MMYKSMPLSGHTTLDRGVSPSLHSKSEPPFTKTKMSTCLNAVRKKLMICGPQSTGIVARLRLYDRTFVYDRSDPEAVRTAHFRLTLRPWACRLEQNAFWAELQIEYESSTLIFVSSYVHCEGVATAHADAGGKSNVSTRSLCRPYLCHERCGDQTDHT